MSIRILCLNILLLATTCYPTAIPQMILPYLTRYMGKKSNDIYLFMCNILYIVLCLISLLVLQESLQIKVTYSVLWYIVAVGSGALLIILELLTGKFIMTIQGKKVKGFSVNNSWKNAGTLAFICTITLAIFEEINFRLLWNEIIVMKIGLPEYVFIVLSANFYAVGHLYYGIQTFFQKLVTGVILSLFYIFSGGDILVPILAHICQNFIILIWGRSRKGE